MVKARPVRWNKVQAGTGSGLLVLALACSSTSLLSAQTQIPPTAATPPSSAYTDPAATVHSGRAAVVSYNNGLLAVTAANSSLNQILVEISRQTGMKITGRVAEDRVFGSYGPDSPSAVLALLLEGTSSNMLVVQDALHRPTELILTARTGGVTPPNPNAAGSDDAQDDNSPPRPAQGFQGFRPIGSQPRQPPNTRSPYNAGTGGVDVNPAATAPSSTSQQVVFPPINATTPPATADTTPTTPDASPNAARTPQQIFEQLQKLREQQPAQTAPQ